MRGNDARFVLVVIYFSFKKQRPPAAAGQHS
jgi:hypothetical protein